VAPPAFGKVHRRGCSDRLGLRAGGFGRSRLASHLRALPRLADPRLCDRAGRRGCGAGDRIRDGLRRERAHDRQPDGGTRVSATLLR
jgi:hypothetical protein